MNIKESRERALRALKSTSGATTQTSETPKKKVASSSTSGGSSVEQNQSNKALQTIGNKIGFEEEIFHLKMDIISLWSILLDKKIDGQLRRKDIEKLYNEFRVTQQHLINQMDVSLNKDYGFNEIEGGSEE